MNQSTLQRFAHTAIGIPVHAVNALMERVEDARRRIEESKDTLSDSARADIDRWALEGEALVSRILGRVGEETPDSVKTLSDTTAGVVAAVTSPQLDVTGIPGIGEAYADRLRSEGVTSVAAFMQRTSDDERTERLAAVTDISPRRLMEWRSRADLTRIDGIDEARDEQLREAGFASIESIAAVTPTDIIERLEDVDMGRAPSKDAVDGWVAAARKITR